MICDRVGAATKEETLEPKLDFTVTLQVDLQVRHLCILNSFKLHELDYTLYICANLYKVYENDLLVACIC
jgi:hypothetical protein